MPNGVEVKVGSFLTGTGIVGSTVAVAALGFSPDAIIFFYGGRSTVNSVARGDPRRGHGFAARNGGGVDNACAYTFSTDAAATMDCEGGQRADACVQRLTTGGVDGGRLHVSSLDAGGFTMTIDTVFGTSLRIGYMAIGGVGVTGVTIGTIQSAGGAGALAVTGVGSRPDGIFFTGIPNNNAFPATTGDSRLMFGAATRRDMGSACIAMGSNDGAATSQAMHYALRGQCMAHLDGNVTIINDQVSLTSFDADGFTLNFLDAAAPARKFLYLAITGPEMAMGYSVTPTDTVTTKVINDFGLLPEGILFAATEGAECAADTPADDDAWSMGAIDSAGNKIVMQVEEFDGAADAQVVQSTRDDAVFLDCAYTPDFEVTTGFVQRNLNAFSILNSVNSIASAEFFWFVVIGNRPTVPTDICM